MFKGHRLVATIAGLTMALPLAACGSDDSSSSSATSAASTASTAAADSSPSVLEEAKQAVAAAQEPSTTWAGPTAAPKPATGKHVFVVTCSPDTEGCLRDAKGAVAGAEAIGWKATLLQTNGTVQSWNSTLDQALTQKADAIIVAGMAEAAIQAPLKRAAKEGVPVVTMLAGNQDPKIGTDFKGGLYAEVNADATKLGALAADWAIVQTDGKAKIGVLTEKTFPILGARIDAFTTQLKKCSGCEITKELNIPVATLASQGAPTVSQFLRANPDVNYLFSSYDGVGVFAVQGIKDSGSEAALVGQDANAANLDFIRNGQVQTADVGYPLEWAGWAAVDQVNRAFAGEQPAKEWTGAGGGLPLKLITKDNLPDKGESFTGDMDYESEFKKLWDRG